MNLHIFKNISMAILFGACSVENTTSAMNQLGSEPCDCSKTFEELIVKLESNYIGLALITDTVKLTKYRSQKNDFLLKSNDVDPDKCAQFLNSFLSPFEDGHLFVNEYPQGDSLELLKNKQFLQNEAKELEEIYELAKDTSASIVGLWSDGESVFHIVRNGLYFNAYLVKSNRPDAKPGSLKLRLRKGSDKYEGTYYTYSYNARYVKGNTYKENQVLKMGSVFWSRVYSKADIIENIKVPRIRKIDEENTLLTIPSFLIDYKDFQKFLKDNKKLIKETSHLIIDIRGNTGGNAIYFPLIEYFATHPLKSRQGYVLTSDDNRAYFKQRIGFGASKVYSPLLDRMGENGKIVDGPKYPVRDFGQSKNKIQRVSILMDNGCASAAESFVLHAKGTSDKVMTLGSPSRGMIDFTSVNSLLLKNSGRQNIYFGYPTGTLHQDVIENGYNETGIVPDVIIPSSENKLQSVIKHFNNRK